MFYAILYLGHPLTPVQNFKEIIQGNPSSGTKNERGVAKHNDFGPVKGYFGNGAGLEVSYY